MQAVAAWLVARPLNAVLALAMTISLGFLSGVVLVLLVLHKGVQKAAVDLGFAAALLAAVGLIMKAPLGPELASAASIWMPALLLGGILNSTRSLNLTLQLSVVVMVAVIIGFYLYIDNPMEFWRPTLMFLVEVWREAGWTDKATALEENMGSLVGQMPMAVALTFWGTSTISFILGYLLYRALPDETARFGRFRDLTLGKVIAITMAIASVAALLTGAVWLQSIAFAMFLVFWLQGLAVIHWLHGEGHLPTFGVVAMYVLMPFLNIILLLALAVVGYIDTWFRLRRNKAT